MYNDFMEAKITDSSQRGIQPVVTVGFFHDKKEVFSKQYFLDPGQTIDDIKPQIKEDLNRIEKTVEEAEKNREFVGKKINLDGVKSASEIRAEKEKAAEESPVE